MTETRHDLRAPTVAVVLLCIAAGDPAGGAGIVAAGHGDTAVTFDDQTATTTVVVSNVTLQNDGYVTIHNESFAPVERKEGHESIIGVSDYLTSGNHSNVTVTLYADVPGRTYDQDRLVENRTLVAAVYGETNTSSGNTTFNRITHTGRYQETGVRDGPYRDDTADPAIIHDTALVTVPGAANESGDGDDGADGGDDAEQVEATEASVTYDDQRATDTVTVASATLPDGGFVTVHNASGGVVGATDLLDPGTHENLTVEVSPAFDRSGVSIARVYRDNATTGTFDPTTDAAYNSSTGNAVSSTAYITVESAGTATETVDPTETSTSTTAAAETSMSTTAAAETESATAADGTATQGPGFTVVLALLALVGAALVAVRRA